MVKTIYRLLYNQHERDDRQEWVMTGEFGDYATAINALRRSKRTDSRKFRLIKITEEELLIPEIKELQDASQNQPR